MYERAKKFLDLLRTVLTAVGFLAGIAAYGMYNHMYHSISLTFPFIGAFIGVGLSYVAYFVSCACIRLSYAIEKKGGPAVYIQKKLVLTVIFLAMLVYFIAGCFMDSEGVRTYFSLSLGLGTLPFMIFAPCAYPVLLLLDRAPYTENIDAVKPMYITLLAFTLFVVLLYLYANWLTGSSATAYDVVTIDRESGHEVGRRSVSYSTVVSRQNIIGLLLLVFSLLTWPPITITVLLVRMYTQDYLC